MSFVKKLISILIVSIFSSVNIVWVWAIDYINEEYNNENQLIKNVIISKIDLEKITNWKKYINSIDNFIGKIKNNKDKLENLQTKIYELENKYYTLKNDIKIKKLYILLSYLEAKVNLELYKIKQNETNILETELNKKIEEMKNSTLSESENKVVNDKLVKIQLNLLENTSNIFENIIKEFDNISDYEGKGNIKFNFNLNHDLIWKIKTDFKLNDYTIKKSGFDTQFNSQIEALIDAEPKWENAIKLQISSFIDFISKDGNLYILLNKFNIIDEKWIEDLKTQLEEIKQLALKNKYVKIEDQNNTELLNIIKNFNPSQIISDWKNILSNPLFKTYKKQWDKYFLIPTKYACDEFKKIQAKLDPLNWNKCSDSQYETLLTEIAKSWDLYIELWTKNKLWFSLYPEYDIKSFESYIIFTDTSIDEINSELLAKKVWEWFKLEYIKNNKLNFKLNAWDEVKFILTSSLDSNNNSLILMNFNLELNNYYQILNSKLKLENKNITGTTTISDIKWIKQIIIDTTWKYETNYLELNNKIESIMSITDFVMFDWEKNKSGWNINIKIDTRNKNNNSNLYINYSENDNKILEIELDNKSIINYKNVEIKAPTDTIDLNEAINLENNY